MIILNFIVLLDGTVGIDISLLVSTFTRGMNVDVQKVRPTLGIAEEPDYGFCEASIGRLDMDILQLEGNLTALLEKLGEDRPKRKDKDDDAFITRCILKVLKKAFGITLFDSSSNCLKCNMGKILH